MLLLLLAPHLLRARLPLLTYLLPRACLLRLLRVLHPLPQTRLLPLARLSLGFMPFASLGRLTFSVGLKLS
jgi:hypothetical protein